MKSRNCEIEQKSEYKTIGYLTQKQLNFRVTNKLKVEAKKRNTMQLVKNHKNWGEWINNRQYKL